MGFWSLGLGSPREKNKKDIKRVTNIETLHELRCTACPLNSLEKSLNHPKMGATGSDEPLIYILGEAPGCISGDSLVDTAFRDKSVWPEGIPIRDLVGRKDFYVYSFSRKSQKLVLGKVKKVWKTGQKRIYRVTYGWYYNDTQQDQTIYLQDSLEVTSNHRFLLKRALSKRSTRKHPGVDYLSIDGGLSVGHRLQPFYRSNKEYSYVGTSSKTKVKESRFLLEKKIGRRLLRRLKKGGVEECHHKNENKLDDSYDNLELHTTSTHARHHLLKNNPMSNPISRTKHQESLDDPYVRDAISRKASAWLATPEGYAARMRQLEETNPARSATVKALHFDPTYKYHYLLGRQKIYGWSDLEVEKRFLKIFPEEMFPPVVDNHIITNIEYIGIQDVYDMEVERYHNFAVNGIFVHNSQEDEEGRQFVGESGQLLRRLIPSKYRDKIRWNNTLRCRPPKNRNPTLIETECCRQWIVEDIEKSKPKAIFAIGGVPLTWLNGSDGVYRWRGRYSPVRVGSHVCWAFFHLHPAGLLRMRRSRRGKEEKSEAELTFIRDLKQAFRLVTKLPPAQVISPYKNEPASPTSAAKPLGYPTPSLSPKARQERPVGSAKIGFNGGAGLPKPVLDYTDPSAIFRGVSYVTGSGSEDVGKVASWLRKCKERPSVALDLETNTKEKLKSRQTRPYGKGAKILSVALAFGGKSFAFPLHHQEAGWSKLDLQLVEKMFLKYLRNARGVKVAHNLSFELEWLGYFYGKELIYWGRWGDTMGQAYVLDERRKMLSLDDLTLQHFGFNLKSLLSLDLSNLDSESLEMVLTYNALDSLYEHRLYLKQRKLLKEEGLLKVYQQHIPPIQTAVLTQLFGNRIDFDLVKDLDKKYSEARDKFASKIKRTKAVKDLERMRGKPFNPSSHPDVIALFKDSLDHSEVWDEEKGRFSADDKALSKIDRPLARWVRKYRSYSGMKSKYLDPLIPEADECVFPDGKIHPNLHIFFTATGRTSSSDPNEQFWPKREEEFKELRAEFVAEKDCYVVTIDQGQIEARVIQMAAKDKRYGQYLWDRQDVHMDWTERLAHAYPARIGGKKFIKDKDVMKRFRYDIKNQWTFPLFFGASSYSVSNYLSIPMEIVRPYVDVFWDEFSGIKEWQEELESFYRQNGYVQCLTGRRRRHPISHNELINSPIQGTASDITVSAWSRLSQAACELDMWQFQARLEVHDELVFHLPKKTFDRDLEFVVDHLLDCEHFDFINVPLCVEVSCGPDWFHQDPVGVFYSDDFGKIDRKKCGY